MTVAQNIEMVRQYWEEVWNRGSTAAVPKFYAPHCIHGKNFTIEGFQKNVADTHLEFPDFAVTIDDIFGLDNKVVSRVTYNGTHTGSADGSPPTGRSINVLGLDIFHIEDGKFVEHWHSVDHLKVMRQLGVEKI